MFHNPDTCLNKTISQPSHLQTSMPALHSESTRTCYYHTVIYREDNIFSPIHGQRTFMGHKRRALITTLIVNSSFDSLPSPTISTTADLG